MAAHLDGESTVACQAGAQWQRFGRDHDPGRLVACLPFFSVRFSFSDLPDFFD